jgi:NADP-dependent 3-hydroxy acid dehydrogenase YdfG
MLRTFFGRILFVEPSDYVLYHLDSTAGCGGGSIGGVQNKVVVITGASSGIGQAAATRLATQGHQVVLAARRVDRLTEVADQITAQGGQATVRAVDVTNRFAVASVVDGVVDQFGRIDVLIGNAGLMPLSRLDALLVEEWDQMIDVNVRGLLYSIAAALPHFQRQDSGHFVTLTSIAAHDVIPMSAVYSATKFAAWAITEGLRLESPPGIRVTAISPGMVATEAANIITDPDAQALVRTVGGIAISADAIADAIAYAISQPPEVDVNEVIIRPTAQR